MEEMGGLAAGSVVELWAVCPNLAFAAPPYAHKAWPISAETMPTICGHERNTAAAMRELFLDHLLQRNAPPTDLALTLTPTNPSVSPHVSLDVSSLALESRGVPRRNLAFAVSPLPLHTDDEAEWDFAGPSPKIGFIGVRNDEQCCIDERLDPCLPQHVAKTSLGKRRRDTKETGNATKTDTDEKRVAYSCSSSLLHPDAHKRHKFIATSAELPEGKTANFATTHTEIGNTANV